MEEEPQSSRKRKWEETVNSVDPKVIEGKQILRAARNQQGLKGDLVLMYSENQSDFNSILYSTASAHKLQVKLEQVETTIQW